jgi:hypothetical protein
MSSKERVQDPVFFLHYSLFSTFARSQHEWVISGMGSLPLSRGRPGKRAIWNTMHTLAAALSPRALRPFSGWVLWYPGSPRYGRALALYCIWTGAT